MWQLRPGFFDSRVNDKAASSDAAATTAFLARTSGLNAAHTNAYKALINGLVSDLVFSKLDVLLMYATADATTALLNLVNTNNATNHSSTLTADAGFSGGFVDTGADLSTLSQFSQNSAHISIWNKAASPSNTGGRHGVIDDGATKGTYIGSGDSGNNGGAAINNAFDNYCLTNSTNQHLKHIIGNRTASNARNLYVNGASDNSDSAASTTLVSGRTFWTGSRDFGGSANQATDAQIMMVSIGASLNGTEAAALYARVHTYLQTIAGIA